jgi:hypothetical protein
LKPCESLPSSDPPEFELLLFPPPLNKRPSNVRSRTFDPVAVPDLAVVSLDIGAYLKLSVFNEGFIKLKFMVSDSYKKKFIII